MIQVLIIDDEQKARSILHHYLADEVPHDMDIRQAASVDEALDILHQFKPDLVFLDVEMPVKSGFDFLIEAKSPEFDIIFTTAFDQYAIQAIRFSALDYLLKPIDVEELKSAIARYLELRQSQQTKDELYSNLVENLKKQEARDYKIAVTSTQGTHFFMIQDVIRLEADSSYTHIHLTNGKRFTASKTLKYFDEMLEEHGFLRTHKSHMINPTYLRQVNADHTIATMSDGSEVEVARRKKDEVKDAMKNAASK